MGMIYITREGETNAAVDLEAVLTTCYSDTAPGPIVVPQKTKLKQIIVSLGNLAPITSDSQACYLLRMVGTGMVENEQQLVVGWSFNVVTAKGDNGFGALPACVFNVDIDVKPGGTISLYATQSGGVDLGTPTMCVSLGFA